MRWLLLLVLEPFNKLVFVVYPGHSLFFKFLDIPPGMGLYRVARPHYGHVPNVLLS